MTICAIVSGGLDSTVAAHLAAERFGPVGAVLSFDYGQRHRRELDHAALAAQALRAPHHVVDLTAVTPFITRPDNSLIGAAAVPDGHYAEQTMRATVVSNRNMIMYSVAAGFAAANDMDTLVVGVHGGDHFIYPDCRPEFVSAFEAAARLGTLTFAPPTFKVYAPFVHLTKTDIVREGHRLGVDMATTWSCYKGGDVHCGACGTCYERREAFIEAGVPDPTVYLSTPEYADPRV